MTKIHVEDVRRSVRVRLDLDSPVRVEYARECFEVTHAVYEHTDYGDEAVEQLDVFGWKVNAKGHRDGRQQRASYVPVYNTELYDELLRTGRAAAGTAVTS